jgi:hypothetical protein
MVTVGIHQEAVVEEKPVIRTPLEHNAFLRHDLEIHDEDVSRIPRVDASSSAQEIDFNNCLLKKRKQKMEETALLHDLCVALLYGLSFVVEGAK